MKQSKRPCAVTVEASRLRISAAAGTALGERADLYRCGQIYALVNAAEGSLTLHRDLKVSERKNIGCATLALMLREQYGAAVGKSLALPAWYDPNGILLFGRMDVPHPIYPDGFRKVQIPVEEYLSCPGTVKGYTLLLSRRSGLEGPVKASVRENVLCLEPDPMGSLWVDIAHSRPRISSRDLTDHIRDIFPGQTPLAGWRSAGRLYLASRVRQEGWDCPGYIALHTAPTEAVNVRLGDNDVLYFSAAAVEGMDGRVSLWLHGHVLALRPDRGGGYRLYRRMGKHYACIHRSTLARFLRETQRGGRRFYARRVGDTLYFSGWALPKLPPQDQGVRVQLRCKDFQRQMLEAAADQKDRLPHAVG